MFLTIEELHKQGLPVEVTESDKKEAHAAFATSKIPKTATPGAIVHLESILTEWDQEILDVGRRLRNYVTNKLIADSADPDAKVRLRALELLGKVSSVGLFSERIDVNVTHRTVQDIEAELKKTLELYGGPVIDVQEVEEISKPKAVAEIDLDAELGTPKDDAGTA
jgi:hypothetical protein